MALTFFFFLALRNLVKSFFTYLPLHYPPVLPMQRLCPSLVIPHLVHDALLIAHAAIWQLRAARQAASIASTGW